MIQIQIQPHQQSSDKSELEQEINQAEKDLDNYTESRKNIIEPLLEEAKITNDNPEGTQPEVDDITNRLQDALDNGELLI